VSEGGGGAGRERGNEGGREGGKGKGGRGSTPEAITCSWMIGGSIVPSETSRRSEGISPR